MFSRPPSPPPAPHSISRGVLLPGRCPARGRHQPSAAARSRARSDWRHAALRHQRIPLPSTIPPPPPRSLYPLPQLTSTLHPLSCHHHHYIPHEAATSCHHSLPPPLAPLPPLPSPLPPPHSHRAARNVHHHRLASQATYNTRVGKDPTKVGPLPDPLRLEPCRTRSNWRHAALRH